MDTALLFVFNVLCMGASIAAIALASAKLANKAIDLYAKKNSQLLLPDPISDLVKQIGVQLEDPFSDYILIPPETVIKDGQIKNYPAFYESETYDCKFTFKETSWSNDEWGSVIKPIIYDFTKAEHFYLKDKLSKRAANMLMLKSIENKDTYV